MWFGPLTSFIDYNYFYFYYFRLFNYGGLISVSWTHFLSISTIARWFYSNTLVVMDEQVLSNWLIPYYDTQIYISKLTTYAYQYRYYHTTIFLILNVILLWNCKQKCSLEGNWVEFCNMEVKFRWIFLYFLKIILQVNKWRVKFGGFSEYPPLLLPATILPAINKRTKVVLELAAEV